MEKHDTHYLSNSSSNNFYEGQKNDNKLVLYKNINNENKKKEFSIYYNEEDMDQNILNTLKNGRIIHNIKINEFKNKNNVTKNENNKSNYINNNNNKNINYNNKINNKINNNNNQDNKSTINNDLPKKTSMINFVSKEDKSKNLFVFKNNNSNGIGFNMINKNIKTGNKNYYGKNKNYYGDDNNNYNHIIFDINHLKKIKTNKFKIIAQKNVELPISSVCHFKKCTILIEQKYKLPTSNICYFNKITLFTEEKIKVPPSDLCYFIKSTIIKEKKILHSIANDYYFCSKINQTKHKESFVIENCIGLNFSKTFRKRRYNNNISNLKFRSGNNNKENIKILKQYQPKPKNKRKKEDEYKYEEYKKKLNNRLKSYKSIDHDEIMKKLKKEQEKKNQKNKIIINKNLSIKNMLNKYNSFPKRKQKQKQIRVSKTEKENNITDSEEKNKYLNSSLSNNKSNNNKSYFKYSFYSLFDINTNRNYSSYRDKKTNKKILQRFIENGQRKNKKGSIVNEKQKNNNNNNIKYIMPKINVTSKQHTPKSKTIFTTQSSRFLIKKINSTNFKNNSNSLVNIHNNLIDTNDNFSSRLFNSQNRNYYNNDLPGIVNNVNMEHQHLYRNECNHHKYDKHFGNELNCPKCQSMDMKFNYLKEKKNERIPNINSHYVDNTFNKTLDSFKKDNIIIPMKYYGKLYLRNHNNHRNNSKNFLKKLHKNNSVVHIKKINVSKYSDQILKNYKSNLLAIKEYFNIK